LKIADGNVGKTEVRIREREERNWRVYRRYCKEDIDVGIEANTRWRRLRQRERIRVYRRYCKDIEDIETDTKWRRLRDMEGTD
jgi:hypothetical protein